MRTGWSEPAMAGGSHAVVSCRSIEVPSRRRASCRSEEHTSELQSLMRISYAVFCLKKKNYTSYSLLQKHEIYSRSHFLRCLTRASHYSNILLLYHAIHSICTSN